MTVLYYLNDPKIAQSVRCHFFINPLNDFYQSGSIIHLNDFCKYSIGQIEFWSC